MSLLMKNALPITIVIRQACGQADMRFLDENLSEKNVDRTLSGGEHVQHRHG